jgi:hypothetical protein
LILVVRLVYTHTEAALSEMSTRPSNG